MCPVNCLVFLGVIRNSCDFVTIREALLQHLRWDIGVFERRSAGTKSANASRPRRLARTTSLSGRKTLSISSRSSTPDSWPGRVDDRSDVSSRLTHRFIRDI
jgi:hypothetical protein